MNKLLCRLGFHKYRATTLGNISSKNDWSKMLWSDVVDHCVRCNKTRAEDVERLMLYAAYENRSHIVYTR